MGSKQLGGKTMPSNILRVGNLSVYVKDIDLVRLFEKFGALRAIINGHQGYGFVYFENTEEARMAIESLQGAILKENRVQVEFAKSERGINIWDNEEHKGKRVVNDDLHFGSKHSQHSSSSSRETGDYLKESPIQIKFNEPPSSKYMPYSPYRHFETPLPLSTQHSANPNWQNASSPCLEKLPNVVNRSNWSIEEATNKIRQYGKDPRSVNSDDSSLNDHQATVSEDKSDDHIMRPIQPSSGEPIGDKSVNPIGINRSSPASMRASTQRCGPSYMNSTYIWRGIIEKTGDFICFARCIPMGEGIKFTMPEIINCTARVDLDKLTQWYIGRAIGFDVVYFLPDSEVEFESYTAFVQFLGARNCAGVVSLDGTTLFLVPPSDFLRQILKVKGPERLYGVIFKFLQELPSSEQWAQPNTLVQPQSWTQPQQEQQSPQWEQPQMYPWGQLQQQQLELQLHQPQSQHPELQPFSQPDHQLELPPQSWSQSHPQSQLLMQTQSHEEQGQQLAVDRINSEYLNQSLPLVSTGQTSQEVVADNNQSYEPLLQYAAYLLQRVRQMNQQESNLNGG